MPIFYYVWSMFGSEQVSYGPNVSKLCPVDSFMCLVSFSFSSIVFISQKGSCFHSFLLMCMLLRL